MLIILALHPIYHFHLNLDNMKFQNIDKYRITRINIVKTIALLISINIITSCEKETAVNFTDTPIITAFLEPGSQFSLEVDRQIPFAESVSYSVDDINNLNIAVDYNGEIRTLVPIDSGRYVDSSIVVKEGDEYKISFSFNEKKVTAYTYIPSKPTNFAQSATKIYIERIDSTTGPPIGGFTQPDPIELSWDNFDESYYLVLVENIETTLDPIRDFGDAEPPGNRFKKSPTNSSYQELRSMDFQYFGVHRVILYHVLPDYATLYEDNSTSSQNITNPSTSIVNGYGIFTGFSSDTLYVNVLED